MLRPDLAQPLLTYNERLRTFRHEIARLDKRHAALGYLRLLLISAILVTGWLAFHRHQFSALWVLVPLAGFAWLLHLHSRVLATRSTAERAVVVYEDGLARIEDRWSGRQARATPPSTAGSLYAEDFDLFGAGSLFELLCRARTWIGETALASWLLAPATLSEIHDRQAAVTELRGMLGFQLEMATAGDTLRITGDATSLFEWAEARQWMQPAWLRLVAPLLAACAVAGLVYWSLSGPRAPFVGVVLIEAILAYSLRHRIQQSFAGADTALGDLAVMTSLLTSIEGASFQAPKLVALQQQLAGGKKKASEAIASLRKLVQYIDSRDNLLVKAIDVPLLYSLQLAFVADAWRREHGQHVRRWLSALGEMEALLSLATYSYEHPADPFPVFLSSKPGPGEVASSLFQAERLGHPLIAADRCVRNDLEVGGPVRVALISGSNMSGKSTLMRAAGINIVLAMAGAPVRAARLQLTPMQVAASILVNDSLRQGASRFYAEISRLRAICDLAAGPLPVFFLLDELLQGTNSRDRLVGARGITQALIETGAAGLISTHDLALTEMAQPDDLRIRNLHFEDKIEDGKMLFDFLLRDGPVTRSNGIELMRMVGLKV